MEEYKNADRFTGFADVYESARPHMPGYPIQVICGYLERAPELVVDLGCGTGLSTVSWKGAAARVIGIEPSEDMLQAARQKAGGGISFIKAYSAATTLPGSCADAVVCSQSFHWMEPVSTLAEADRILKPGGVFATVDCDWPPRARWQAEKLYDGLYAKVKKIEAAHPDIRDSFVRYDKSRHLENIRESGHFRYCRELLFANTEPCTAQRFVGLLMSQGSLQAILKVEPGLIEDDIKAFKDAILEMYGEKAFDIDFYYRMRVGIK